MTRRPGRNHTPAFRAKVALAALKGEKTPTLVGGPKTGYMIESMIIATAHNIRTLLDGREPTQEAGTRCASPISVIMAWFSSPPP